jgi:hypothetical protein
MVIDGHFEGSFPPILSTSSVTQLIMFQLLSTHHPWVNSADRFKIDDCLYSQSNYCQLKKIGRIFVPWTQNEKIIVSCKHLLIWCG